MAKPNRTVAEFRRKHPRVKTVEEKAAEQARLDASPLKAIMDKVGSGEWTVEQGVEAVEKLNKGEG